MEPFLVSTVVNGVTTSQALVDSGCLTYGIVSKSFVRKHCLPCVPISPRRLQSVDAVLDDKTTEVAHLQLDVGGHCQERVYLYVVPRIEGYDMILGLGWMEKEGVVLDANRKQIVFKRTGHTVCKEPEQGRYNHKPISAAAYQFWTKQKTKKMGLKVELFSASLSDITKALAEKKKTDPRTKLPDWIGSEFDAVFDHKAANTLPPHRRGMDHEIVLDPLPNGQQPTVPWGPLYNMSQEELLVLRKTLTNLLDKGFIRVSNSPAAAPVLFVRKPGGGLRFCCDYRALNKLSRKDRYPLPLIQETLNQISKAKWFTKMDVAAAFYKLRIKEGDEWLTAFRTRFGLYEWLVTPFGLANAPSTFQRYINYTLREYLDEFVSAYVDDILVFTDGTREQHREQVRKVLTKLSAAGLQLDIDKCEFEVQSTKYLGFILEAGTGLRMDPAKVDAIREWEAPTTVKGVLGFLGFANFYRRFIKGFSEVTAPLYQLVKKDIVFDWSATAEASFNKLKQAFISAPVLAQFKPEDETVLETDSSGYCIGGVLSQYKNGVLRPVGYYSRKNQPAECNYPIYDKELLAIIKCLEEWEAELKSVGQFTVLTDHKNLEYFTTIRKLSERQMRWQLILSKFNPVIRYRPGKDGGLPDALTRRPQDLPTSSDDERLNQRMAQLIPDGMIQGNAIRLAPVRSRGEVEGSRQEFLEEVTVRQQDLQVLWTTGRAADTDFQKITSAIQRGSQHLPGDLTSPVKVSASDCTVDDSNQLRFRGRIWVPDYEPLRTAIIQEIHDSTVTGHPGKNGTIVMVSRDFFWPNLQSTVKQFVRNCSTCGRTKVWRDQKQGLLRPLPVPEQQWQEISMDFIGPLPLSRGFDMILVFVDRLGKGVLLEACHSTISTEELARIFIRRVYGLHGLPTAMVSDRGPQFISHFWKRLCQVLRIERRLSTAFHPQTDGQTERANAEVERLLRQWVNEAQDDWEEWLPVVQLALNGREASATSVSPFFLSHGYHLRTIDSFTDPIPYSQENRSPIQRADAIASKIREVTTWAQTEMAKSQQDQEVQANRLRKPAPAYQVGDKVWLNLRNVRTTRVNKKLDYRSAKYTVTEVINGSSYRLDTPPGIHNVFNVDLLRPAATDPLPSQLVDDPQPPAIVVDNEEWWLVESIIGERTKRLPGRGKRTRLEYRVKWKGYAIPTWEPANALEDVEALDAYLKRKAGG